MTDSKEKQERQEKERREKREVLLEVFGTPRGARALNIILEDLRFFHWTENEGERALNEYAKFLIRERLGVADTLRIAEAVMAEASQSRGGV
ncbi:MAG: hypothetical protein LBT87_00975 [Treponema sp.]|jgi:hypothetical protein|nr:hypothetical protein [Treponema sp.]